MPFFGPVVPSRDSCSEVSSFLDYEKVPFFLSPSNETRETRKWPRTWLKAREGLGTLVSCVSQLRRSTFVPRACNSLTESGEKQRLLAIYKFSDHVTKESEAQGSRYKWQSLWSLLQACNWCRVHNNQQDETVESTKNVAALVTRGKTGVRSINYN